MKLLHVTSSLDPQGGGPPMALRNLAVQHALAGNTVEIATLDALDAPWLASFPCRTHPLGPPITSYRYSPKLVPWLQENAGRFDAVIVDGIWQYHSFGTWRALRGSSVPYFVFTHGMLDPWFKHAFPFKHYKKWLYWPWAEYRVLRDAAAVLFTCEDERLLAPQSFWLSKWKSIVVNFGTAPPIGNPEYQKHYFLKRFPDLANKKLLLFMSRIHPKKGCDLLLRAFARISPKHPNMTLMIAGPDQMGMQDTLIALSRDLGIEEKVIWPGMLEGDLKWGALRTADAFVLPSHSENFGIVVAEALACGTPVLISDKVNIWREIADDGAGFVAPDTLDGTVNLLERWTSSSPDVIYHLRDQTTKCFSSRFHIKAAADSIVNAIANYRTLQYQTD